MRRDATVISVDLQRCATDDNQLMACVELEHVSQCLRCSRGQGCGAANQLSSFTEIADNTIANPAVAPSEGKSRKLQLYVNVEQGTPVEVGQRLVIDIDDEESGSTWLWAVFGAYGLPLVGMLFATGVASALWGGADSASRLAEFRILVSAGAGLFLGILAWRLSSRRLLQMTERSLCLLSARIVTKPSDLTTAPNQHWK